MWKSVWWALRNTWTGIIYLSVLIQPYNFEEKLKELQWSVGWQPGPQRNLQDISGEIQPTSHNLLEKANAVMSEKESDWKSAEPGLKWMTLNKSFLLSTSDCKIRGTGLWNIEYLLRSDFYSGTRRTSRFRQGAGQQDRSRPCTWCQSHSHTNWRVSYVYILKKKKRPWKKSTPKYQQKCSEFSKTWIKMGHQK